MSPTRLFALLVFLTAPFAATPASARTPPRIVTLLDEKFEQWQAFSGRYADDPDGEPSRAVTYRLGESRVYVNFTCRRGEGWSITIINNDTKKRAKDSFPPKNGRMFYRLDGGDLVRIDGFVSPAGQVFYYPLYLKDKSRAPLVILLRAALQAERDIEFTLPPDRQPFTVPVAGLSQAIQRFTDVCPL